MALMPKRVKYRKLQRGRRKGISLRSNKVNFGEFGLKALDNGWIKSMHIEAVRVIIARQLRRGGKLWIRIFPDRPVTTKGVETSMGGGKGNVDHYIFPVRQGRIIVELDGLKETEARAVLGKAADKLPIKTKFIKK